MSYPGAVVLIAEMELAGHHFHVRGEKLVISPPPPPDPEIRARIGENKADMMDLVGGVLLTDEQRADVGLTFAEFRANFAKSLSAAGWDRLSVFGDVDIFIITRFHEIPGVLALLIGGWRLEKIEKGRLLFSWGDEWLAKVKGGGLVATAKPVEIIPPALELKNFCPACHRRDVPKLPPLEGVPPLQWLKAVADGVGGCKVCLAFIAATIPMPEGTTVRQQRELCRAIEGKVYDVGILDSPDSKIRIRRSFR